MKWSTKSTKAKPEKHIHLWNVAGPLVKHQTIVCYCSYEKCGAVGLVENPSAEEWQEAISMIPGEPYKWPGNYWVVDVTRSGSAYRQIVRTAKQA